MNAVTRFFRGVNFFLHGLRMLFRYPRLFGLAFIPIILTILVLVGLAWGGAWMIGQGLEQSALVEGRWLLQVLAVLLIFFVAYLIYLPLTRIFLAPFSDKLSRKTTELSGAVAIPESEIGFLKAIWEGVKLVVVQLVIVLFILVITLLFAPIGVPLGIFMTICFCGLDFVDVPLSVRGLSLRQKLRFLWGNRAFVLGFAVAAYVLLHIPIVNLLALPVGVIGGTLLVNQVTSESLTGEVT